MSVQAGTTSRTGTTSGGSAGTLNCTANLEVNVYYGTATTGLKNAGSVNPSSYSLATTIIYYYTNSNYQPAATSSSGTSSAAVANPGFTFTSNHGSSSHSVSGSSWGSWSTSLSVGAG